MRIAVSVTHEPGTQQKLLKAVTLRKFSAIEQILGADRQEGLQLRIFFAHDPRRRVPMLQARDHRGISQQRA